MPSPGRVGITYSPPMISISSPNRLFARAIVGGWYSTSKRLGMPAATWMAAATIGPSPTLRCGATRTENDGFFPRVPAGGFCIEIGGKTIGVGIRRVQLSILEPQRVRGADELGDLLGLVGKRKDRFLVRNGDVAADEICFTGFESFCERRQFIRNDPNRLI